MELKGKKGTPIFWSLLTKAVGPFEIFEWLGTVGSFSGYKRGMTQQFSTPTSEGRMVFLCDVFNNKNE